MNHICRREAKILCVCVGGGGGGVGGPGGILPRENFKLWIALDYISRVFMVEKENVE